MIFHTILPRAESRKKLYENTDEVKEKKIVIPVRSFKEPDEVSSPLLKKRRKNKDLNLGLKIVEQE